MLKRYDHRYIMTAKSFIGAQEFLEDSYRLGFQIINSTFRPKFIIGVWRGGSVPGIAIQELLSYKDIKTDHIAIRTSSYTGMCQRKEILVHGLEYIVKNINSNDNLLIVDDVFDSGNSIAAVLEKLKSKCRKNTPENIKIATVWFKPTKNQQIFKPDYYVHESSEWLVFPHELEGLTKEEILTYKGIDLDALQH